MENRNSLIELFRFIFASCILLFHVAHVDFEIGNKIFFRISSWNVTFFRSGYIGVEYFFIISGLLMAKHVFNHKLNKEITGSIGEETVSYIYRKLAHLSPYYFVSCALMAIVWLALGRNIGFITERIPSLFFLHRTGLSEPAFLGLSWYISSMFIAMALVYPFLRKYYYTFTTLIAPFIGVLTIGAIIKNTGTLSGVTGWALVTYKCNFRALLAPG